MSVVTTSKILIVEDDEWLAEQQGRTLSVAGYAVHHTPHALAAIAAIDDFRPDVILLDVLLTGSTAFAFLHELQSYQDTGQIPVILCTNMAENLSLDDLRPYGVRRILDKAMMEPADVVAAVRSVLL
jgi:CheY-like chemotaxis protein